MDRLGCVFLLILAVYTRSAGGASYAGLFVSEDSFADTGNHEENLFDPAWRPPNGMSWPGYPTGGYSDGRVFTDFYGSAEAKVDAESDVRGASYGGLFVFGDSFIDTGNHDENLINEAWRSPFGSTWPGYPIGRFSDGFVFTDFYASSLNVSNPIPYRVLKSALNSTSDNTNLLPSFGATGINFGFGGSGVGPTFGPIFPTISDQIDELEQLLREGVVSREMLKSSVVLLVVAGNDYITFLQNHVVNELPTFIPRVVAEIGVSLVKLYNLGFRTLVVTNLEPVGCLPYITSSVNYTTCKEISNIELSIPHNTLLAATITNLQLTYLNAKFIPLNFYMAFNVVIEGENLSLRPCCEGVNGSKCGDVDSNGSPLYKVCSSPQQSLFWDYVHPSNAGWKAISKALLSTL